VPFGPQFSDFMYNWCGAANLVDSAATVRYCPVPVVIPLCGASFVFKCGRRA
jgi:hypothetical protein